MFLRNGPGTHESLLMLELVAPIPVQAMYLLLKSVFIEEIFGFYDHFFFFHRRVDHLTSSPSLM